MIKLVDVVEVKPLPGHRLWVRFSDSTEGERDYSALIAKGGPMLDQLKDQSNFGRVFLSFGVPTWPNGFDVDVVNLQMELRDIGALNGIAA